MAQPTFSLIYTSVRSAQILPMVKDWVKKALRPEDLEVIVVIDGNDEKSKTLLGKLPQDATFRWFVQPDPPFNCVRGWNLAASKATGKVIIQLTDDIYPPDSWDAKLQTLKPDGWINEDWAVHVEDGYVHDIMVIAIVTKVRYDRFGYLFYPDYQSLFCDTELTAVAYSENRAIVAKELLFEHMHPDCQKRDRDDVDAVHASKERWFAGETLFNFRKANGFPIDVGPKAVKSKATPPPAMKFCVYVQATRDDLCLFEVCQRMREEGVNDFFFSVPDEYWSGRPTPPEEMQQVKEIAQRVKALGSNIEVMFHRVKSYRWPGDTRLKVETRVRNDALGHIRGRGFEHVLIVDGDELWKRGTLNYVREIINRWRPTAINCLMIPVVGCPGYPINGASDVAVIYINSSVPFKECRTPVTDQWRLQMPQVIHFTGTRRTMEETIRKHTDSGHFDDPKYLFNEWIEKVLPNIKPGFTHLWPNGQKGLHMFQDYQIWQNVRDWMADELCEIPQTLWPYLGIPEEPLLGSADARAQTHK